MAPSLKERHSVLCLLTGSSTDNIHDKHDRESAHAPRKIIKNRGHFPSDEAAIKLLWLVFRNVNDGKIRSAREWKLAMNQLAVWCGDRFVSRAIQCNPLEHRMYECMVRPVFARSLGDSAIEPAEMYPAYLWSSTLLALMESARTTCLIKSTASNGPTVFSGLRLVPFDCFAVLLQQPRRTR